MPYKDKEKSKEAATERQRKHRQGVTVKDVVTPQDVTPEYIKSQLPSNIVKDIERIIVWFERLGSGISPEKRWENAYRYHVWNLSGRPRKGGY